MVNAELARFVNEAACVRVRVTEMVMSRGRGCSGLVLKSWLTQPWNGLTRTYMSRTQWQFECGRAHQTLLFCVCVQLQAFFGKANSYSVHSIMATSRRRRYMI